MWHEAGARFGPGAAVPVVWSRAFKANVAPIIPATTAAAPASSPILEPRER